MRGEDIVKTQAHYQGLSCFAVALAFPVSGFGGLLASLLAVHNADVVKAGWCCVMFAQGGYVVLVADWPCEPGASAVQWQCDGQHHVWQARCDCC
jgi:hypothetical protein